MPLFSQMPNFNQILSNPNTRRVAIGVGVVAAVGIVGPVIYRATRPVLRQAVKSAILFGEKGREVVASASEAVEDLVAEVRSEIMVESASAEVAAGDESA